MASSHESCLCSVEVKIQSVQIMRWTWRMQKQICFVALLNPLQFFSVFSQMSNVCKCVFLCVSASKHVQNNNNNTSDNLMKSPRNNNLFSPHKKMYVFIFFCRIKWTQMIRYKSKQKWNKRKKRKVSVKSIQLEALMSCKYSGN